MIISKSKKIRAIRKSIIHWQENVDKIIKCKSYVQKKTCSYSSIDCALCNLMENYGGECTQCPLEYNGYGCFRWKSPYSNFCDAMEKETALARAKNMVKVLREILEKELKNNA